MTQGMSKKTIHRLRHEPLFWFLLIALGLFAVDALVNQEPPADIVISAQAQAVALQEAARMKGSDLTAEEKANTLQQLIDEELLLEEALQIGLYQEHRIRRLVLRKIRYLLTRDTPNPTQEQLAEYYQNHKEDFQPPPKRQFQHVIVAANQKSDEWLLKALEQNADVNTLTQAGVDLIPTPPALPFQTRQQVMLQWGKPVADALFNAPLNQWIGPVSSAKGKHYLKVMEARQDDVPPFEQIQPYVKGAWIKAYQEQQLQKRLRQLADKYQVLLQEAPK